MEQVIGLGLETVSPKALPIHATVPAGDDVQGARAFGWILEFTPLLWLGGLLPFCTPLVLLWVFVRDRCWKHMQDPAVSGWFAIGAVQMLCTFLNWSTTSDGVSAFVYRCFSAPISGWIFLGLLMAIGKELGPHLHRFRRNVCYIGVYSLLFGLPLLAYGLATGTTELEWLTPIGHLIPASLPSAQFEFTAQFLTADDFVGQTMPRLVLFYPWPTCLGFAGAAVLFISLASPKNLWSILGFCGGVFGVFASTSRAAVAGTILGLAIFAIFRVKPGRRPLTIFVLATVALFALWLPILFQSDPIKLLDGAERNVSGMREDSSSARDQLYKETYLQFKKAPYIGYGWQGNILDDYIPLNIGSHSSIYGLLYTGGIVTLTAFVAAIFLAGVRLLRNAVHGTKQHQSALSIFVVLIVMCYGECIYSFAIPVFFAFLWIGSALGAPRDDAHVSGEEAATRGPWRLAELKKGAIS